LHSTLTGFDYKSEEKIKMKLVKKLVLPVLFVSVLAVNAYAGEIETPGYVPPPPPPDHSVYRANTDETTNNNDQLLNSDELSDQLLYDAMTAILSMF
jgi:hypothetical protein